MTDAIPRSRLLKVHWFHEISLSICTEIMSVVGNKYRDLGARLITEPSDWDNIIENILHTHTYSPAQRANFWKTIVKLTIYHVKTNAVELLLSAGNTSLFLKRWFTCIADTSYRSIISEYATNDCAINKSRNVQQQDDIITVFYSWRFMMWL